VKHREKYTGWARKRKSAYCYDNFVCCQPILIILADTHRGKLSTGGYYTGTSNAVCVTL